MLEFSAYSPVCTLGRRSNWNLQQSNDSPSGLYRKTFYFTKQCCILQGAVFSLNCIEHVAISSGDFQRFGSSSLARVRQGGCACGLCVSCKCSVTSISTAGISWQDAQGIVRALKGSVKFPSLCNLCIPLEHCQYGLSLYIVLFWLLLVSW